VLKISDVELDTNEFIVLTMSLDYLADTSKSIIYIQGIYTNIHRIINGSIVVPQDSNNLVGYSYI
jgi:hypothetical protein